MRSQITEREAHSVMVTSRGMGTWLEDLRSVFHTFEDWDDEDKEFWFADLEDNLEEQAGTCSYCLDALEDMQSGDYVS